MLQDPGWYVKHAHARTHNTHPVIPEPMHQQSSHQPRVVGQLTSKSARTLLAPICRDVSTDVFWGTAQPRQELFLFLSGRNRVC